MSETDPTQTPHRSPEQDDSSAFNLDALRSHLERTIGAGAIHIAVTEVPSPDVAVSVHHNTPDSLVDTAEL